MSIEFTGERVVPGHVDEDLWNEHIARYLYAARFCAGRRVLDAGCGTGYGANALAASATRVIGIDVAADAVLYASGQYSGPNLEWTAASCTQLPFPDASFDVVVAFEVIEHLEDWPQLLVEASRVLAPDGLFVVSTPNKSFYAETRDQSGPNPYHQHEFEFEEFHAALHKMFAHVQIALENHAACVVMESADRSARATLEGSSAPGEANFYIAICSRQAVDLSSFVYVPKAANILKERALHIKRLAGELETKNDWLQKAQEEHAHLVELHSALIRELETSNAWAQKLDAELKAANDTLLKIREAHLPEIETLQQLVNERTEWAHTLEAELQDTRADLARCVSLLDQAELTVTERSNWALQLQAELEQVQAQLAMAKSSRWVKLGRLFNIGPGLNG